MEETYEFEQEYLRLKAKMDDIRQSIHDLEARLDAEEKGTFRIPFMHGERW